ncbi:MAG: cob(I)yrinic acid a,c-diamide adenosyltransferase [Nevskia sp.]|uniref:cob(I)yrinic acid a,c-diamide adenosyltransferase n=1 Tax=Nevskia sp. TaxID=1929292 RepID=UPI004035F8F6
MGNRLSKIVTRTGDKGTTGLSSGERVPKTHLRVQAMGDVDELNCCIGLLLVQPLPSDVRGPLAQTQHELFDLGGELSMPGFELVKPGYLVRIDAEIERLNEALPPLKEFVLPGGNPSAAAAHLARAVARRAERAVWSVKADDASVSDLVPQYLNRLSDYLFVCCRVLARLDGGQEVSWKRSDIA